MIVRRTAFVIVNIVLLTALGLQLTSRGEVKRANMPRRADKLSAALPRSVPPMNTRQAFSEQPPLFRIRHNVVDNRAQSVVPKDDRPPFQLVGILHGDEGRIVVVAGSKEGEVRRLRVGQEHSGWRLVDMTPRVATFRREESLANLSLAASK